MTAPFRGEFDGVGEQIRYDLGQSLGVRVYLPGYAGVDAHAEKLLLFVGLEFDHVRHF
jgi:hypothetical protein